MEQKAKGYIVCEKTLKELQDIATKESYRYNQTTLYECDVDRGEMSEEQRKIQIDNRWNAETCGSLYISEDTYYNAIKDMAYKLILGGEKENIADKVKDAILNTKVKSVVSIIRESKWGDSVSICFEFGDEEKNNLEYTRDLDEMKKELETVAYHNSFMKEEDKVLLERLKVEVQAYRFDDITTRIGKLVNKFMRENLTYCIKNNMVIIPQEYLDKGIGGIEEWREIKRSSNKNNSIEKRLIKEVLQNKRAFAYDAMHQILFKITRSGCDWSLPVITVDGQWNKTKINKLVTKLADTKNKQKFMETSEEEIFNTFKEYWKEKLMEIYDEIDKAEIKNER